MACSLRLGRVDWGTETAGTAMQLQRQAGAVPMLITERNGVNRYHSVFLARRDSNIVSLEDLPGHSIAFQHSASRSEEHTSELQSLMRSSYAVFFLIKQNKSHDSNIITHNYSQ